MSELLRRLHTETFVLDVSDDLPALETMPGFELHRLDDRTLEVSITRDSGLNALFALLNERGIEVISLRNKQNRLEQLFIDMVNNGVEHEEVLA